MKRQTEFKVNVQVPGLARVIVNAIVRPPLGCTERLMGQRGVGPGGGGAPSRGGVEVSKRVNSTDPQVRQQF